MMSKLTLKLGWLLVATAILFYLLIFQLVLNLSSLNLVKSDQLNDLIPDGGVGAGAWNLGTDRDRNLEFLHQSEKIWKKSLIKRREEVERSGVLTNVIGWGDADFVFFWDYFYPAFNCPYPLERIGRVGDGGKWVCGFYLYEVISSPPCIIYSFGVAREVSFENEVVCRSNCEIWAYDPTVKSMGSTFLDFHPQIKFKEYALGNGSSSSNNENWSIRTLGDIMRENGHDWIDILKVDIEGAEFSVFDQILGEFDHHLPFGQLLIELHLESLPSFRHFYQWWEALEGRGVRAIRLEPNNVHYADALKPVFMEVVFVNVAKRHRIME